MGRPYLLVDVNPNDSTGGGGCACYSRKAAEQEAPYLVFPQTDMEDPMSPHNVVCARCARGALELEVVSGGETWNAEATELPDAVLPAPEGDRPTPPEVEQEAVVIDPADLEDVPAPDDLPSV